MIFETTNNILDFYLSYSNYLEQSIQLKIKNILFSFKIKFILPFEQILMTSSAYIYVLYSLTIIMFYYPNIGIQLKN